MRLLSIAICRVDVDDSKQKDGDKSVILCQETDTSKLLLGKGSMKEMATFIVREISSRIDLLTMKSLEYKGNICHAFRQQNGLCVCVLTDDQYPPRAAHGLIRNISKDFESCFKPQEWQNASDLQIKWPKLAQLLLTYQDPPKDKIEEIQSEIEKSKQVVIQSIDKVMANMEKLDDLVEKSNDLSNSSRMFYKKSKKMNRCCTIL
mmetsp:Transcript_36434/g.58420  ORF Transcript_36434/g.58420 Transcript_36434/m.58420 type:complete len:205 (-) Transcript_36434:223-837(-)|eukprot:CAMPEP_0197024246 /NCGR_PEP_ID=MMETSP1384-20130603/4842_1 /TAXON_ID=29189 /ORGANISM="Ammonia sp." /LENGTH=204 /DNA_ID=CAMNT_0042452601 /DNA_START=94 /DNA_END=708 /DNA_ORIENTATION=-